MTTLQRLFVDLLANNRNDVIKKFTKKVGIVYFGYVDQNKDDHKVVRGLSVSATQKDSNYCVGDVGGYSTILVDRTDVVKQSNGSKSQFNWLIMTFELKTEIRVPHFFISANNYDAKPYEALFSSFPNMKEVTLGTFEKYSEEFTSRFTVFARPAKAFDVEKILTSKTTRVLGAHFWPLSIEQHDNVLYVYAANEKVTPHLLDTMLENGLWLAAHIDSQSDQE